MNYWLFWQCSSEESIENCQFTQKRDWIMFLSTDFFSTTSCCMSPSCTVWLFIFLNTLFYFIFFTLLPFSFISQSTGDKLSVFFCQCFYSFFLLLFLIIGEWKYQRDSLHVSVTEVQQSYQHTIVHFSALGALLPPVDHKFDFTHQKISHSVLVCWVWL